MMHRRNFLFASCFAAVLRGNDDAISHVERLGGEVVRNAAGDVTGVSLSGTWASDADLRWLSDFSGLVSIDLGRTRITGKALEPLRDLASVRVLDLRYAEAITAADIGHLVGWRRLSDLNLRGTRVDSGVFQRLSLLTAIQSLDISSTEVDDEGFEELAALVKLERLCCGANRLRGAALSFFGAFPALRHLDVGGYQRVDSGLWGLALNERNLERLGALTRLESLSLRGAKLADRGSDRPGSDLAIKTEIVGLDGLSPLTRLRTLDLGDLPIQSADLAWLRSLNSLEELDLDGSQQIDDAVADALLPLENLRRLNLAGTTIGDSTLRQLQQLPRLTRLTVGGTQVTPSAVAAFSRARSECEVISWKAPSIG